MRGELREAALTSLRSVGGGGGEAMTTIRTMASKNSDNEKPGDDG